MGQQQHRTQKDYDIYVYDPSGQLESEHTQRSPPRQLGTGTNTPSSRQKPQETTPSS
jgi:hypothetical protein